MKKFYSKLILLSIIAFTACSKDTKTQETIGGAKPQEELIFDNTFILTLGSDKTTITYLNEDKEPTLNIYKSANAGATSFSEFNEKLYVVSQKGPGFISALNLENLTLENEITNSEALSPSYLQMYSETDGLVITTSGSGSRKKTNVSIANSVNGIGAKISGLSDAVLFNNTALLLNGKTVLIADGKELKSFDIDTKTMRVLLTFPETISGIVKNKENTIWVATEKRTKKAAFTKLNSDYTIAETIEITDEAINLYKNSILSMNQKSETAYWSESASGKIYRFNTITKITEEFASPVDNNVIFNTVVKEHPITKQVYIAGLEDFSDPEKSILAIYNADKTLDVSIKNIGESPIDIYFSNKEFKNK